MPKVLSLDNLERKKGFSFRLFSLIRTFGCAEGTCARKSSNKIWLFSHLFVPLAAPKVLSLDNLERKKGFSFRLFSLIRTFAN